MRELELCLMSSLNFYLTDHQCLSILKGAGVQMTKKSHINRKFDTCTSEKTDRVHVQGLHEETCGAYT